MKTKVTIITALLCLITINAMAQSFEYAYVRLQADVNNALGIIDNPRTQDEILGADLDIELGARDRHIGVYITYGRFEAQDYQNYAAGVDYYVYWLEDLQVKLYNPFNGKRFDLINGIRLSAGINYGVVMRRKQRSYKPVWGGSGAIAIRGTAALKIYKNLNAVTTLQYQQRPELGKFVLEGAAGIQYNFN